TQTKSSNLCRVNLNILSREEACSFSHAIRTSRLERTLDRSNSNRRIKLRVLFAAVLRWFGYLVPNGAKTSKVLGCRSDD
ncbi:MAG TPA: hypothetical protein VE862_08305, partial [Candidatus Acidoferrum sp.]|nr:hypothetical protein [Candidatus Acidoferrum sp.]